MKKIIITGYMGSGKSTIANALSEKLKLKALDLDEIIEQKANRTIPEIFKEKGEIYFRRLEHESLAELVTSPETFILSLGGGTPCYADNHELLNAKNLVSVYLKTSIATLFERLDKSKNKRPLIDGLAENELQEFIAKHLFDRSFYYNQATHKVITDGKSVEAVTDEIMALLA